MTPTTWEEAARQALIANQTHDYGNDSFEAIVGWIDTHLENNNFGGVQVEAALALAKLGKPIDKDAVVAMLARKQHDYGHDNILRYGIDGVKVRISDKVCRLRNLLSRGLDAANEAIEDSWLDIVGYSVIAIMLHRDTFKLPLASDSEPERYLVWRYSVGTTARYNLNDKSITAAMKVRRLLRSGAVSAVTLHFPNGNSGTWTIEEPTEEAPF